MNQASPADMVCQSGKMILDPDSQSSSLRNFNPSNVNTPLSDKCIDVENDNKLKRKREKLDDDVIEVGSGEECGGSKNTDNKVVATENSPIQNQKKKRRIDQKKEEMQKSIDTLRSEIVNILNELKVYQGCNADNELLDKIRNDESTTNLLQKFHAKLVEETSEAPLANKDDKLNHTDPVLSKETPSKLLSSQQQKKQSHQDQQILHRVFVRSEEFPSQFSHIVCRIIQESQFETLDSLVDFVFKVLFPAKLIGPYAELLPTKEALKIFVNLRCDLKNFGFPVLDADIRRALETHFPSFPIPEPKYRTHVKARFLKYLPSDCIEKVREIKELRKNESKLMAEKHRNLISKLKLLMKKLNSRAKSESIATSSVLEESTSSATTVTAVVSQSPTVQKSTPKLKTAASKGKVTSKSLKVEKSKSNSLLSFFTVTPKIETSCTPIKTLSDRKLDPLPLEEIDNQITVHSETDTRTLLEMNLRELKKHRKRRISKLRSKSNVTLHHTSNDNKKTQPPIQTKLKLIFFNCGNRDISQKPYYHGSFSGKSKIIRPQKPFEKDKTLFNYDEDDDEYDETGEEEEEEPLDSEDLGMDFDEEDDEAGYLEDLVVSDDVIEGEDEDPSSEMASKISSEKSKSQKKSFTPATTGPTIIGPVFETKDIDQSEPSSCLNSLKKMKSSIVFVLDAISFDDSKYVSSLTQSNENQESKNSNGKKKEKIIHKTEQGEWEQFLSDDDLMELVTHVHGSKQSKSSLVDDFFEGHKNKPKCTKKNILQQISNITEKKKISREIGTAFLVKDFVLQKFELDGGNILENKKEQILAQKKEACTSPSCKQQVASMHSQMSHSSPSSSSFKIV